MNIDYANNYEDTSQLVCEPAVEYMNMEASVEDKIEYLSLALHPSTVEGLKIANWMEDMPFPLFSDTDDSWVSEAENATGNDIVNEDIINRDRAAWLNIR